MRVQESQEMHREGAGARGRREPEGQEVSRKDAEPAQDLHFLVVTNAVSEDVDLQGKDFRWVRPRKRPLPGCEAGSG